MLPTTNADHTRFNLRKGSAAATWDTVKGIEWNRLCGQVRGLAKQSVRLQRQTLARIVLTSTPAAVSV